MECNYIFEFEVKRKYWNSLAANSNRSKILELWKRPSFARTVSAKYMPAHPNLSIISEKPQVGLTIIRV